MLNQVPPSRSMLLGGLLLEAWMRAQRAFIGGYQLGEFGRRFCIISEGLGEIELCGDIDHRRNTMGLHEIKDGLGSAHVFPRSG
jgi:hypothetical protein